MNKLKAKFGKKHEATPLTTATKDFIKGEGDQGLQFLPSILEACSSASEFSLTSQVEVLDLITKYYTQHSALSRQLRCIDLLRYLSDQHDNELFNLLSQGHPLLKSIDGILKNTRGQTPLQKHTRILLDHLVRQPNVPDAIVELHAKHVNGFNSPHKPTIILSDQEVVADDIAAGTAEAELLATLLTEGKADESLVNEVFTRIKNTRERLMRDIDTSTNEMQTVNLIETVERIDRVLVIYDEAHGKKRKSQEYGSSAYVAPSRRSSEDARSTTSRKTGSSRTGKSRAVYDSDEERPLEDFNSPVNYPYNALHRHSSDDNYGEGSSKSGGRSTPANDYAGHVTRQITPPSSDTMPHVEHQRTNGHSPLSSNNPFAPKAPQVHDPERNFSPTNPYASIATSPPSHSKNPFTSRLGQER